MFSGKKPDCSKCPPNGYVLALPSNYEVLEVIDKYGHTLVDGNGSIKLQEIDYILNKCCVESTERNVYKIVVYLSTAISTRHKELNDGQKHRANISNKRHGKQNSQNSYL